MSFSASDSSSRYRLTGGVVLTHASATPLQADIYIADGLIAHLVDRDNDPAPMEPPDLADWDELRVPDHVILPGFKNLHVHPGATPMLRGVAEDVDIPEGGAFFHSLIPLRRLALKMLTPQEVRDIVEWDVACMLLGGATTIVAEDFGSVRGFWPDLVEQFGFRSSYGLTYPASVAAIGYSVDGKIQRDAPESIVDDFERSLRSLDGSSAGGLLSYHLSPHGPDTVGVDLLERSRDVAAAEEIPIHMHCCQHRDELRIVRQRDNCTPVELLERIGLLSSRTVLTHNTYATDSDWALIRSSGATSVICPTRKMREGSLGNIAPAILGHVRMALGTDSFAHSLFDDLRLGGLLGKAATGSNIRPTSTEVLSWATGGCGPDGPSPTGAYGPEQLAVGSAADLLVLDLKRPATWPPFSLQSTLVNYLESAALKYSIVGGRLVINDGALVGLAEERLQWAVQASMRRVWTEAGRQGLLP